MTSNNDKVWDVPAQEHHDATLYVRYHRDVWLPDWVVTAARAFLPQRNTDLILSDHYRRIEKDRKLPHMLHMPRAYDIIDVTMVRGTRVVFRVLIRAPFNNKVDIGLVLEGDHEVVTAFWASPNDNHPTLDISAYEQEMKQGEVSCTCGWKGTLDEVHTHTPDEWADVVRRESRPDDMT